MELAEGWWAVKVGTLWIATHQRGIFDIEGCLFAHVCIFIGGRVFFSGRGYQEFEREERFRVQLSRGLSYIEDR